MNMIKLDSLKKVAQCRGLTKSERPVTLDFYRLTNQDRAIIEKLEGRYQGLNQSLYDWAIQDVQSVEKPVDSFIAAHQNNVCGIITGLPSANKPYKISKFITWGVNRKHFLFVERQKVKNTGAGLLDLMLHHLSQSGIDSAELFASTKAIPFYKSHGFVGENKDLSIKSLKDVQDLLASKLKEINMQFL